MIVHLDFESRSQCDLKACGPHRYAQDPSTEILCAAFAVDDNDVLIAYPVTGDPEENEPDPVAQYLWNLASDQSVEFHAFNASFESSIWSELMVKVHAFPPIAPERWHCTASQAYALSLPRTLDAVAQIVVGPEHQKDKDGAALMRKMCIIKGDTMPEIDANELIRLGEYCKQDVRAEREVARKLPPLSPHEQAIYVADQKINKRGALIDVELVTNAVAMVDKCIKLANEELKELTSGAINTIGQVAAIQKFALSRGVRIDGCTAKILDAQLEDPGLDPVVRRVFELRRSTGRAAVKKYAAMLKAVCSDGRIRDHLMYCGAGRTRRWSGQRLQTQNIARGYDEPYDIEAACVALEQCSVMVARLLFDDPMIMLSGLVRSMIRASAGHELLVADFSNIEARVLAVISGNKQMLEDYKNELDPYISFAMSIYDRAYDRITKEQRFFGKQAILGLGYGMGSNKFGETCANYGKPIDDEFAQKIVTLYREKNHMVPALWERIENDAKKVIQTKKPLKRKSQYYGFRWDFDLNALVMVLPNGSERYYIDAAIELREKFDRSQPTVTYKGTNSITGKWETVETWGGKLVENLVQSIARELQAEAILAVENAGHKIVLHAHDEIVCECLKGQTDLDELIELMTTASPWARDWPIGADGWIGPRYKK